jgi:hypothetical protein
MKSHQVKRFVLLDERTSEEYWGFSTMFLVKGIEDYATILKRAFPALPFEGPFPNDTADFDWFLIADATAEQCQAIQSFLTMLGNVYLIKDTLDECYALALHTIMTETGTFQRTPIGQLVREAKPYDSGWNAGNQQQAGKLADFLAEFVRTHPTYARVPLIAAVPPSNPDKQFDLPALLAERLASLTGKQIATSHLRKVRATLPMKNLATLASKAANVKDAFYAEPSVFVGKDIFLVDDIYHTGSTINEVGRALRIAGVRQVFGLTLTKTIRNF